MSAAPATVSADWFGWDRATLDAALNNAAAVPNSGDILSDWENRSATLRASRATALDLPYGPGERNRLDLFLPWPTAPTLLFIHGGYWQMRSKEGFSFVAEGPLARGINVALAGYTLAPAASLDEMVREVGTALDRLQEELSRRGHGQGIWLSGWSAGGHLATMQLGHPLVRGGLTISGLYDLEPIRHSYVNDRLGLDAEAAARNSPLLGSAAAVAKPLSIAVGADELPMLRNQSRSLAARRRDLGLEGECHEIVGANHFTILEQLAQPEGELTRMLVELIRSFDPSPGGPSA